MNKFFSIAAMGALLMMAACNSNVKKTPNGMEFSIAKAGDGVLAKTDEVLVFEYQMKDSKDSVWADTHKIGFPAAVLIADTSALKTENGMVQMFRQLSKGDSVIVNMPIKKFFKDIVGSGLPPKMDSTLSISYLISVTEITNREKYMAKQQELMQKKQTEQLTKDVEAIDKFLAEKAIKADTTSSGLRYVITQPGTGANATPGQSVKVHYAGYLLDGNYFDTSIKAVAQEKGLYDARREPYAPFDVVIERSNVIRGWHEALKLMNKGSKATFYIPSTLGYGSQRAGEKIAENSILVFDIEMVDITDPEKAANANKPGPKGKKKG
ncbi:MAG TPA: FKBP-type peptidyl-prolyl cis-trans isomerase [Cyclobacteriaceae bacterium]|nr:FKBP-type peptidyl-prolyl cis-trans isomerase [Cyclobacteriaceae bacterium]